MRPGRCGVMSKKAVGPAGADCVNKASGPLGRFTKTANIQPILKLNLESFSNNLALC